MVWFPEQGLDVTTGHKKNAGILSVTISDQ
jgi:hypothetical protein